MRRATRGVFLFVSAAAVAAPARADAPPPPGRPSVYAANGMVACAQPLAAQAGLDILKRGGNAVDAAIAMNACLAVTEPVSCGLGGDLFAILWDPRAKAVVGLNASGRAPAALSIDKVAPEPDGTIPLRSPASWTVPGCVDGWFALHGRCGRLPMKEILAPAIRYAEEGFPVSPVVASEWGVAAKVFGKAPGFAAVFLPGGRPPAEGALFRNPALARTLRRIAEGGRDAFYAGEIARALVDYSRAHGGFFALEDFAAHRSTWDAPISTDYRGHTVWELPPSGQGLAALQMLNILETFDLASLGRGDPAFWHLMVEAKKLAYADRARYYADPAFADVPVAGLLSKGYAAKRAARIDPARAAQDDPPGGADDLLARAETTYLCAADKDGCMVSLIQSNYTGFGSGHVVPDLGFGLQNRGALFALDPKHPNALAPGKRPFHTIIPALVTRDGAPSMVFGVMGGDMQPQGHAQILVNLIDLGMGLQAAGDALRFHHVGSSEPTGTRMREGGVLLLEEGLPESLAEALRARGHRVRFAAARYFGGYQAIRRDPETGVYEGATERRKDGCAAGY